MLGSGGAAVKQLLVLPGKPDEVRKSGAVALTRSLIAAAAVRMLLLFTLHFCGITIKVFKKLLITLKKIASPGQYEYY